MLYKCGNCSYTTQRACDLRRHQSRKFPCNKKSKENICNNTESSIVTTPSSNISSDSSNISSDSYNISSDSSNISSDSSNVTTNTSSMTTTKVFACRKCKKVLSRADHLKDHESKCDGFDKKQCKICLKVFSTSHGKWKHAKYVKCKPVEGGISYGSCDTTNNNITNIDNSNNSITTTTNNNITNNNITNNINIVLNDFYKISDEDIDRIVEKLGDKEYFKIAMSNLDLGKYAIPRTVERIYFNHEFPAMQTLRKERRNDKMVDVHVGNGKWEKRMLDDIFKLVIRRVEEYHTKFFRHLEEKYKNVPVGSVRWKQLMRPIKSFGNCLLWYDGFRGDAIECLGIELNYPDEEDPDIEKERERRIKEMERLLGEKVYEESMAATKRREALALTAEAQAPPPTTS